MAEYTTISVPRSLYDDVDAFIADTNFTSVGEFTKHVLRDTIAGGDLETELTREEVEQVRKRLKRLGYI